MTTVILAIHLMLALALVGVILIQRSEGGGLGIGSNAGGFMTTRGTANLLTRATMVLAGAFMLTSLILAWTATHRGGVSRSILDAPAGQSSTTPTEAPGNAPASNAAPTTPAAPAETPANAGQPAVPAVPLAK